WRWSRKTILWMMSPESILLKIDLDSIAQPRKASKNLARGPLTNWESGLFQQGPRDIPSIIRDSFEFSAKALNQLSLQILMRFCAPPPWRAPLLPCYRLESRIDVRMS